VKSLVATAEMDYQLARAAEDNVRKNLDRAQARLADKGEATVALQELENEALARRELYKSFVSRMAETNLQKSTQISDATVVSPAQVPLKPYTPRRGIILALALLAGLGTGISAALLRGRRDVAGLLAARRPAPMRPTDPIDVTPAVAAAPAAADLGPVGGPLGDEPLSAPVDLDALHEASALTSEPEPADTDAPAAAPAEAAAAPRPAAEPVRVDLALTPERIARLGAAGGDGPAVIDAFVETADGHADVAGLAGLRRLAAELGEPEPRVRVLFSNSVPTPIVAALAHGLARAQAAQGARILVVDLAEDAAPFDVAFDRTAPIARSRRRRLESGFDVHLDDHGVGFARPTDDTGRAAPSRRAGRLADFVAAALRDHDGVVVHLGGSPSAALLFDAAEIADHVTLVVDDADLDGRRVAGEIDVMRGLLPRFDGIVVLRVADDPATRRDDRRGRRRA
jgi:hypothetical protein